MGAGASNLPPSCTSNKPKNAAVSRPKVGLALGGGGTRGAAHVGVLRVLLQEGVPIDCIAGTSMGSVVGGLYCAGLSVDEIQDKFTTKKLMGAFLTVPLSVRVAVIPIFFMPRIFGIKQYDGFYRGGKFRHFLNTSVPECSRDIENLKTPFGAVALNLIDGNIYLLNKGNLGRALQASSAVPVLRKPVVIGDQMFVDGGVTANLPVQQAKQLGADIVIAVDVDERFQPVPKKTFKAIGSVAHRVMTLHLAKVDEDQVKSADVVIHPEVNGIGLISMKSDDIKSAIAAGETAARAAMPEIRRKLQINGIVLHSTEQAVPLVKDTSSSP
jgi:NTE family protein